MCSAAACARRSRAMRGRRSAAAFSRVVLVVYVALALAAPRAAGFARVLHRGRGGLAPGIGLLGVGRRLRRPGTLAVGMRRGDDDASRAAPMPAILQSGPKLALGYVWSIVSLPVTFWGYLAGSALLDRGFVQILGFSRESGDAFGPFVTLLGLIYSILLGQIYGYYFDRQGGIQDALYDELSALALLTEVTECLADKYPAIAEKRSGLFGAILEQVRVCMRVCMCVRARACVP